MIHNGLSAAKRTKVSALLQVKVLKIEENDRSRSLQCLLMKSYGCCDHLEGFWKNLRSKINQVWARFCVSFIRYHPVDWSCNCNIDVMYFRQISDASKLADFRELHNLKDDEEIPWELLQSYMNLTGKQVEREHE